MGAFRRGFFRVAGVLVVLFGLFMLVALVGAGRDGALQGPPPAAAPPRAPTAFETQLAGETPERDAVREKMVTGLKARGFIGEIELRQHGAYIDVTPRWMAGAYKDKESVASALLMYAARQRPGISFVKFLDIRTRKPVASFSPELGFSLED